MAQLCWDKDLVSFGAVSGSKKDSQNSHSTEHMVSFFSSILPFSQEMSGFFVCFLEIFIYLFMRDPERGRDIEGEAGSPMQDLIPGSRHHTLSQRQMLNHGATQVP